jgi:dTDP-4-dehydrorhamnose 3,5-epimerase
MIVTPASIPEVFIIEPEVHSDSRGFFLETFQSKKYSKIGLPDRFVQDNHSGSKRGTLRGLHYQIHQAQGKLISVQEGKIFDVAVDLRKSSPTFGHWVGSSLSSENHRQIWIPMGFAHGFFVVSKWAEVIYKVTDYYAPDWERTLIWNDPEVGIEWPLGEIGDPILSARDASGLPLNEIELFE